MILSRRGLAGLASLVALTAKPAPATVQTPVGTVHYGELMSFPGVSGQDEAQYSMTFHFETATELDQFRATHRGWREVMRGIPLHHTRERPAPAGWDTLENVR